MVGYKQKVSPFCQSCKLAAPFAWLLGWWFYIIPTMAKNSKLPNWAKPWPEACGRRSICCPLSPSISLSLSLSIYRSLSLSIYRSLSLSLPVFLSLSLSLSISLCLSTFPSIFLSFHLPIFLYFLSVSLSICKFICLAIGLLTCHSTYFWLV